MTKKKKSYQCPCCGYLTLFGRGGFEICQVCYWEDDGQDDHDADDVRGGPNGDLSLAEARANFKVHGASDAKFVSNVRPPTEDEKPG
ncbi:CPCC family cysteine-rich protein [Horticoccus sp. 23ND18S-11]|uniref:CPCC family cysteine-rich protein n=1 Tax=Horticoccus sp. 23ND18S-11 TaxID=3391832 RepID=UPI0039C95E8B